MLGLSGWGAEIVNFSDFFGQTRSDRFFAQFFKRRSCRS